MCKSMSVCVHVCILIDKSWNIDSVGRSFQCLGGTFHPLPGCPLKKSQWGVLIEKVMILQTNKKNDIIGQTSDVAVQKYERLTVASMGYFMEIITIIDTLCWVPTVCQALLGKLWMVWYLTLIVKISRYCHRRSWVRELRLREHNHLVQGRQQGPDLCCAKAAVTLPLANVLLPRIMSSSRVPILLCFFNLKFYIYNKLLYVHGSKFKMCKSIKWK